MRSLLATALVSMTLAACASHQPAPAEKTAAPAPAPAAATPAAPAPQCWNGDAGAFQALGTKTNISGVEVVCEKTADGKNAQWMGAKKK